MPEEHTRTFTEIVYSGPLSVTALVAIGIAAAAIVVLLTWWESRDGRRWLAPVLVLLRLVAVGVVLWMLAGRTMLTIRETTRPKTIGILVDSSASMGVVDSVDAAGSAFRWALVGDGNAEDKSQTLIDSAAATLAVAGNHFGHFADACRRTDKTEQAQQAIANARKAVDDTVILLGNSLSGLPSGQGDLRANAGLVCDRLKGKVLSELQSLADDRTSGRLVMAGDVLQQLTAMKEALGGYAKQLKRISDAAAIEHETAAGAELKERMRGLANISRGEKVGGLLVDAESDWLGEVRKKARVQSYRFEALPEPVSSRLWQQALAGKEAEASSSTNLSAALEQIARDAAGRPIEAVLLYTDGGHNTGRDPLKVASSMSRLPVFVVPVGNPDPIRDVILHHVQGPRTVFLQDQAVIEGTVDAYGCAGEELVVELLQGETVIDSERFPVSSDTFARKVVFARKAEALGRHEYRLRVRAVPDERVADNNEAEVGIEVIEDKIRVLLADTFPRWEYRYLYNLWRREERVDCDPLVFEPRRDDGRPAQGRGFPRTLDSWARYNVVILGDLTPSRLQESHIDLLEKYVGQRGGTVIIVAGTNAMPHAFADTGLMQMLPVEARGSAPKDRDGFGLYLTAQGQSAAVLRLADDAAASERIWREVTSRLPVYELSRYSKPKPTSFVLINASRRSGPPGRSQDLPAFMCWQKYGRGKVVYLSAPVTYQLRFRHGDRYHHRLWGQLLRWAIARDMAGGSKTVRIAADKSHYSFGDDVQVRVRLNRLNGSAVEEAICRAVARQDGRIIQAVDLVEDEQSPGEYRGTFEHLPAGPIRIQPTGQRIKQLLETEDYRETVETIARIDPPDLLELRNTRCNLPLLTQLAEATGGAVVPPTAVAAAMGQVDLSPEVTKDVQRQPLWTRWACLWIFLGCLAAEWIVRKLGGMT